MCWEGWEEERGGWKQVHNKELCNSLNISEYNQGKTDMLGRMRFIYSTWDIQDNPFEV